MIKNSLKIYFDGISDIGKVRKENQDSLGHFKYEEGNLFIVADGMGGYAGGKLASNMAVEIISKYFSNIKEKDIEKRFVEVFKIANKEIYEKASLNQELKGMGSTCVSLFLKGNTAYIAHVGDSRFYLIRKGKILYKTVDHTKAQELIRAGIIDKKDENTIPEKNVLSRALGVYPEIKVEIGRKPIKLKDGDYMILCSDGLNKLVKDDEMIDIIYEEKDPSMACLRLVNLANERGGYDNITVQVIAIAYNLEKNSDFDNIIDEILKNEEDNNKLDENFLENEEERINFFKNINIYKIGILIILMIIIILLISSLWLRINWRSPF